ncbi:MAG TPA: hypothetical protein VFJ16_02080, partial [Longimicrobium sp.]|nr:hypothetical protein [Longimicrobium sp.]
SPFSHRCAGRARRPDSSRDPLIDPLRQPAFREWPPGRGGLSKKNFDTQRERHLQPLVDRIGASRRPAATKSAMNLFFLIR